MKISTSDDGDGLVVFVPFGLGASNTEKVIGIRVVVNVGLVHLSFLKQNGSPCNFFFSGDVENIWVKVVAKYYFRELEKEMIETVGK